MLPRFTADKCAAELYFFWPQALLPLPFHNSLFILMFKKIIGGLFHLFAPLEDEADPTLPFREKLLIILLLGFFSALGTYLLSLK
jgi:hypothetical protein